MINNRLITVGSKFIVVGIASTLANYGLFYFLVKLGINYIMASIIGYLFGLIIGFVMNNFWTFQFGKFDLTKMGGYISVYLLSLLISSSFLWLVVDHYQANILLSNFIALGISTTFNFIGLNFILYKRS